VQIYTLYRWLAMLLLLTYLAIRILGAPTWWSELILFNSVVFAAILSIANSPVIDDGWGRFATGFALASWGLGSVASALDSFFSTELSLYAEIAYCTFYPAVLFGLVRALRRATKSRALEVLDTLVIALSGTTLIASLLLNPARAEIVGSSFEVFLAIIYPIGDLLLLLTVITIVIVDRISLRNLLILSGITLFAVSDFYYLWQSRSGDYQFGSLTDAGWLLSFVLIGQAFWFRPDETQHPRSFNPAVVTMALVLSALILAIAVLRPDYFPRFVLVPAFATIALAFLRMAVAMNDARQMSNEQILARTDELTGLANRRRFLSEFEAFQDRPGSLLILDLDGFKPVNDRLGHEVGDQLLAQVARRLERVMPPGALLARLGGDEFGALVPGEAGLDTALALRATLSYPFHIAGNEIALDVSIGEAYNEPGRSEANLLRCADEAMYEAKRARSGVARYRFEIRS